MKTSVIITLQHEAIHSWFGCSIEEVEYLKYPHRHNFYITCKKEVKHDDRDIEIIMFKNKIKQHLNLIYGNDFGGLSCEMIAKNLINEFGLNYCKVLEDNENGAEVVV